MGTNNVDEQAVETLCKAIVQTVKNGNSNDADIICAIKSVDGDFCNVSINGQTYKVKNGTGITFTTGNRCLVHCINGNFNNKVIIAKM